VKARRAAVAFIPPLTAMSYILAAAIGIPVLVPVLNTAVVFPFMVGSLRRGETNGAIARMLVWAASMAILSTAMAYFASEVTARLFINGDAYRREMFAWVWTGAGRESDPARFIPNHLLHAAVFCTLSLVSGSVLSMPMGAMLMNYMGHYVGSLGAASTHPLQTVALAWVPWALIRIVSFVTLGVILAGPVLSRVAGFRFRIQDHRRTLLLAGAGLLADIVVKALLAPAWQRWLRATL
jgi:hypothetical protein